MKKLNEFFYKKRILITGCCGTIGRALIDTIQSNKIEFLELIGIDNNENGIANLIQDKRKIENMKFLLSDICRYDSIRPYFANIDYVFHTAAFKHVAICETSPNSALQTNIIGLQNVINSALEHKVKKFIFTSSDKAVNPTNVMGTTKLMGERLVTAANNITNSSHTIFASTRFGNVLGSNGSVVPIFYNQIKNNLPLTLTHKKMSRFFMTIQDAADLVFQSALLAKGGEVFITKMPVIEIKDLASVMLRLFKGDKKNLDEESVREIGLSPGEKMYEELMTEEEISRSLELDKFFVVLPAYNGFYKHINYNYEGTKAKNVRGAYISKDMKALNFEEIKSFILKSETLKKIKVDEVVRNWPGE